MSTKVTQVRQASTASVFLGGVVQTDNLANSADVSQLLATGRAGLYLQGGLETPIADGSINGYASTFAGTGPAEAELNVQTAAYASGYYQYLYSQLYTKYGLAPSEINLNVDFSSSTWLTDFKADAVDLILAGATNVAPIFSPNGGQYPLTNFATNSYYAAIRSAAQYGGALTLDIPPGYFFSRGYAYQQFTYQEIQWAHQKGLRVSVILSPYGDDANFQSDVHTVVQMLQWNNAIPTDWVVENYTPEDPNGIGTDTNPNSMAGAALWIAQHGKTGSSASVPVPTPSIAVSAPGTVQEPSFNAGVTVNVTVSTSYVARFYYGVVTSTGAVESAYFSTANVNADDNGNGVTTVSVHLAQNGDHIAIENDLTNPSVFVNSAPVTITEPVGTMSISAPGIAVESSFGAGVDVTETVTTTNVAGPIYYGVLDANNNVESAYFPAVQLNSNGVGTFTAHLANTGDSVLVQNNLTQPTLRAQSSQVRVIETAANRPTIAISDPGTAQEGFVGAGVALLETFTTTNIKGAIAYEIVNPSGVIVEPFVYVGISNGVGTSRVYFPASGDMILAVDNTSIASIAVLSSPITITDPQSASARTTSTAAKTTATAGSASTSTKSSSATAVTHASATVATSVSMKDSFKSTLGSVTAAKQATIIQHSLASTHTQLITSYQASSHIVAPAQHTTSHSLLHHSGS